ncbi:hypothetical protein XBKQ1_1280045 [Xenorhabdus bovienii str. kraussei Quebec]|uniref:Uncharacterized protein n=1 Tax=Xenorhabdus bovienii str. kraussei Quebec TaxID=1398203 RepID=A0A077PFM9_XENBV|nr:hypothetical protein XBKQ1_1280045 [Xenorhabdus bovienii str. kraussei Quebec]
MLFMQFHLHQNKDEYIIRCLIILMMILNIMRQQKKMNNPAASSGVSKPIVNYRVVRPKGRGI